MADILVCANVHSLCNERVTRTCVRNSRFQKNNIPSSLAVPQKWCTSVVTIESGKEAPVPIFEISSDNGCLYS